MATTETTTKKWTSQAGPRQSKRVEDAISAFNREAASYVELTDHGSPVCYSPFEGRHPEAAKLAAEIGERFDWTVTRENFEDVIAAYNDAEKTLSESRRVKDSRTTPEQRAERERIRQEREAKEREAAEQFKVEYEKHLAELKAKYPWAKPDDGKLSRQARAAANIRQELAREFPGIKFTVKSSSFSMGNSVDVSWQDGPTYNQVNAILSKYQEGSFDGMTDSYNHDSSAASRAVREVLGQSKYVHGQRNISKESRELVGRALCAAQRVTYVGTNTTNVFGKGDTRWLDDHVTQMFSECSLPAGATITGVEEGEGVQPYRIAFTVPEKTAGTVTATGEYEVQQHFHTKRRVDFYIVVLSNRVDRAEFERLRDSCKQAGGWYSRQWGTTPGGFAFDSEADAAAWASDNV